jgi:hypothetical protein
MSKLRGRPKGSKNSKQRKYRYDKTGIKAYKRLWHSNGYQTKHLDFDVFLSLVKMDCYYCGEPPQLTNPHGPIYKDTNYRGNHMSFEFWQDSWILFNGIDKMEHKEDYSDISNLVPCCKTCNFLKHRLGHDQFIAHAHKIAAHRPMIGKK